MRENDPMEGSRQKLLSALGLCRKAGRLVCGTPLICDALRSAKKPYAVIMASDNSENTRKRLNDRCAFYGVNKVCLECNGDALAKALGKGGRVAAAAITDQQLCRLVTEKLNREHII